MKNKEIFKLYEVLQESGMPYFFNWLEDQKPTPFDEGQKIDEENYNYLISIGPIDGVVVEAEAGEAGLLRIVDNTKNGAVTNNVTAEEAFKILKERFEEYKDEWYTPVTEEPFDDSDE